MGESRRTTAAAARYFARSLAGLLDRSDPRTAIDCHGCGSRTIRGGQFAHAADCPALELELAVRDAAERLK
jgi:hypothetical protein